MNCKSAALFALLLLAAPCAFAGEGFGMMKKTVNLTRIHPPQVIIPGTKIAVRVTSPSSEHAAAAQRLQSQLESELLGHDSRFTVEPSHPDATIDVAILQSDYREEIQHRQMVRMVENGKDSKGKMTYRQEHVTVPFKIVNYVFNASFKVHDRKGNRSLAADTINRPFKNEYQEGNGAPDATSLENDAVAYVVNDLTRRLTKTSEVVGVLLPRGSLDGAVNLANAGLWNKYLETLEKMQPLAKPADDAYRQYALGVAYEALGYGADDTDTTLKYLEQASVHYNNAVDANPKEGYFTKGYQSLIFSSKAAEAPIGRVQSALVQYQKVKEFAEATASPSRDGSGATGAKGALDGPAQDAVTNASVIEMLRAGLPEDVILTSIESAPRTEFDVSPKGLIQLGEAKASKKVIQRIQSVAKKSAPAKKQ
jgi:tetratricopeptide (TPR) repeat protein